MRFLCGLFIVAAVGALSLSKKTGLKKSFEKQAPDLQIPVIELPPGGYQKNMRAAPDLAQIADVLAREPKAAGVSADGELNEGDMLVDMGLDNYGGTGGGGGGGEGGGLDGGNGGGLSMQVQARLARQITILKDLIGHAREVTDLIPQKEKKLKKLEALMNGEQEAQTNRVKETKVQKLETTMNLINGEMSKLGDKMDQFKKVQDEVQQQIAATKKQESNQGTDEKGKSDNMLETSTTHSTPHSEPQQHDDDDTDTAKLIEDLFNKP